jgi:hypothetical protein
MAPRKLDRDAKPCNAHWLPALRCSYTLTFPTRVSAKLAAIGTRNI